VIQRDDFAIRSDHHHPHRKGIENLTQLVVFYEKIIHVV
jgi:hypothetical protein